MTNEIPSATVVDELQSVISFDDATEELLLTEAHSVRDLIVANHVANTLLWREEDLARRKMVNDSEIVKNKRMIDKYNQARNDYIEKMDDQFISVLRHTNVKINARLNSETLGSIIDRLSINKLKIRALGEQKSRIDVGNEHLTASEKKYELMTEQRLDLSAAFDGLVKEVINGSAYFKVYRQIKLYNDPKTNPAVYGEK